MGFLDDLKRQAASVKAEQNRQSTLGERNLMLADAACKTTFQYWLQLAEQLNTLRPDAKGRYLIDGRQPLAPLPMREFRVDARRKGPQGQEHYDHAVMHWTLRGPAGQVTTKDFVNDIERIESRLHQAGIKPLTDSERSEETGKLLSVRYAYDAHIACSARATPDHANARLNFKLVNVDGLETLTFSLPAFEIGAARLDELAKWLLGEPHQFLAGVQDLRRSVPG